MGASYLDIVLEKSNCCHNFVQHFRLGLKVMTYNTNFGEFKKYVTAEIIPNKLKFKFIFTQYIYFMFSDSGLPLKCVKIVNQKRGCLKK